MKLLLMLSMLAASSANAGEVAYLTGQLIEGNKRICYYHSSVGELIMVREATNLCPITVDLDLLITRL